MAGSKRLNCPFPNKTATKGAGGWRAVSEPEALHSSGSRDTCSFGLSLLGDLGQVPASLWASTSSSREGAAGHDDAGGPFQP